MVPDIAYWRQAERSDLVRLEMALRRGQLEPAVRTAILTAIQERAAEVGGRFAQRTRRLIALYGKTLEA